MSEMTISQALRRIKDVKGELAEQEERAKGSVTYKQADAPAYAFGTCVEKAAVLRKELLVLESRVAHANATTEIEPGVTLVWAVKRLKEYKAELAFYASLKGVVLNQPTSLREESSYDFERDKTITKHVEYTCAFPEQKRADEADRIKTAFRKLNDIVETTNHRTLLAAC